jgi:hypothetical protein
MKALLVSLAPFSQGAVGARCAASISVIICHQWNHNVATIVILLLI